MTVAELVAELAKLPQDAVVVRYTDTTDEEIGVVTFDTDHSYFRLDQDADRDVSSDGNCVQLC